VPGPTRPARALPDRAKRPGRPSLRGPGPTGPARTLPPTGPKVFERGALSVRLPAESRPAGPLRVGTPRASAPPPPRPRRRALIVQAGPPGRRPAWATAGRGSCVWGGGCGPGAGALRPVGVRPQSQLWGCNCSRRVGKAGQAGLERARPARASPAAAAASETEAGPRSVRLHRGRLGRAATREEHRHARGGEGPLSAFDYYDFIFLTCI
jgi:hypothetical protein